MRNGRRYPADYGLRISWQTGRRETRIARAKCLDISESGARVECNEAVAVRTNVYVQGDRYDVMGHATVRHCSRHGNRYILGLHFSTAVRLAETGRRKALSRIR